MPALALALLVLQSARDVRPLASEVREVTVFADRALVRRTAAVPAGGGAFVVAGLPLSADPDHVRVRCEGGDVTDVDVTEVRAETMPDARREELRRALVELGREEAALEDERRILEAGIAAVAEMMTLGAQGSKPDVVTGKLDVAAWSSDQDALLARLRQQRKTLRELEERRAEAGRRRAELQSALGAADVAGGALARQVALEVVAGGPALLEIEYVVGDAGWHPAYDLRTAQDARSVELVYRADVFQRSGEDWRDVDVSLSTAQPQVGAQGPDPVAAWVDLHDPDAPAVARAVELDDQAEFRTLGYTGNDRAPASKAIAPPPRPFATVESQGLSVRFRLPRKETLLSRPEPTRVLVAQETLKVEPEYFCTPALDRNVWLRGKATNATPWTILPGRAAVYFGADFLGHAALAAVQPGESFTLHLGRDPGLSVERVRTEDVAKQPGVFGSRVTQVDGWRVEIANTGALVASEAGVATVFVREALPRPTDDRVKVDLAAVKPAPSTDARWKKDRDEQGFVTWAVQIPRGGKAEVAWKLELSYPEGAVLVR